MLALLGIQGCDTGASPECTLIGGLSGVSVEVPRALYVPSGAVTFEVCDGSGCESATKVLADVGDEPTGRGSNASFEDLGRAFEPGTVTVTVELIGPAGRLVAVRSEEVELVRTFPNGKQCDGDGFVGGALTMSPGDRV